MSEPAFKDTAAVAFWLAVHLEDDIEDWVKNDEEGAAFKSDEFEEECRIGITSSGKYFLITITEVKDLEEAPEAIADLFTEYEGEGA